jgi:hypothetical protein
MSSYIGVLSHLVVLDLSANAGLSGTIPTQFAHLTDLVTLVLSFTGLSGVMPFINRTGSDYVSNLKFGTCDLSYTCISVDSPNCYNSVTYEPDAFCTCGPCPTSCKCCVLACIH